MLANATRVFGQHHTVAIGGWAQDDDNAMLGAARSRGWYAMPTFSLGRLASVGLEARSLHFSAGTELGRLTTDEGPVLRPAAAEPASTEPDDDEDEDDDGDAPAAAGKEDAP